MSFRILILSVILLVGTATCSPEGRVINGTATEVIKFPFMVSLRTPSGGHFCGGSIIAPHWILTAAHCIKRRMVKKMTIQFATTKINVRGNNVIGIKRTIPHEDYKRDGPFFNDIGLIELEGSFIYNYKTLAPVTLPEPFFEIPQSGNRAHGILAGWGLNETKGSIQENLQEVNLKIYSDYECNLRHDGLLTTDHVCAGVDEGGKGLCSGDSGGPLLYNGSIQLGIASTTRVPCSAIPGIYTKVSHYIDWIYKHIN